MPGGASVESVDGVNSMIDRAIGTADDATPSPSPAPGASPVPSPSPSVDDVVAAIASIRQDERGGRIASTGTFQVTCLLLAVAICTLLVTVLKRR